jgi:hypothetical protein
VVNLRPESDPETEYVSFDRPRVLQVLARIVADLDGLAGFPPIVEEDVKKGSVETRRARHRRRLAESDPPAKPLTAQEERAALRALLKLPPSERVSTSRVPACSSRCFVPPVPAAFFARKHALASRKCPSDRRAQRHP